MERGEMSTSAGPPDPSLSAVVSSGGPPLRVAELRVASKTNQPATTPVPAMSTHLAPAQHGYRRPSSKHEPIMENESDSSSYRSSSYSPQHPAAVDPAMLPDQALPRAAGPLIDGSPDVGGHSPHRHRAYRALDTREVSDAPLNSPDVLASDSAASPANAPSSPALQPPFKRGKGMGPHRVALASTETLQPHAAKLLSTARMDLLAQTMNSELVQSEGSSSSRGRAPSSFRGGNDSSARSRFADPNEGGAAATSGPATTMVDIPLLLQRLSKTQSSTSNGGGSEGANNGRGAMVFVDGAVYEGDWVDGAPHGTGICCFPSGNMYIGEFVCGEMEGKGTMLFASGALFSGHFLNSNCHGSGYYVGANVEYHGEWRHGERVSCAQPTSMPPELHRAHTALISSILWQVHAHFIYYAGGVNSMVPRPSPRRPSEAAAAAAAPLPTTTTTPRGRAHAAAPPREPGGCDKLGHLPIGMLARLSVFAAAAAEGKPAVLHSTRDGARHSGPFGSVRTQPPTGALGRAGSVVEDPHALPNPFLTRGSSLMMPSLPKLVPITSAPTYPLLPSMGRELRHDVGSVAAIVAESTPPHRRDRFNPPEVTFSGGSMALDGPQSTAARLTYDARGSVVTAAGGAVVGATVVPRSAIFSCAGPSPNEFFSMRRYLKYLGLFLFPFLSLPHVRFCPLIINTLEVEREFVVSGAALRRDFEPPTVSIYISAVALCCEVAAIALVAANVTLGPARSGRLTLEEMVVPCVLWFVLAAFCGGYNGYALVAHPLERLDRHLTPKLAVFAASVVDSHAVVCIYTWDEEGRGKVTNTHYRWRWLATSVVAGAMMCFAAPATRAGFGQPLFGSEPSELAAGLLTFAATFLFSATLTYYVNKITDMQRQIAEQMKVLTRLATLQGVSIMRPSYHLPHKFDFDAPLDLREMYVGFSGWYITRCLVLYAATCSNHASRSAAMSAFFLMLFAAFCVAMGDIVYAAASRQTRTHTYYTGAHSVGLVVLVVWGGMLFRYLYACLSSQREAKRHRYLMDIAALYQLSVHGDAESSRIIAQCCHMADQHDHQPALFSFRIQPLVVAIVVFLNVCAVVAVVLQLGLAIYYTPRR